MNYDVLIVGGGPAGASVGMLLARTGLAAVIIDKSSFPRPMPCGGMISPRCIRAVEAVFGENIVARVSRASSAGCRMFDGQELVAEADDVGRSFFVERSEMDALFFAAANDAGCDAIEGDAAAGVEPENGAVRLASGRTVRGSIIVGADGGDSIVRRTTRGWRPNRRRAGFGLVADVPFDRLKRRDAPEAYHIHPHIHFGVIPWGYGWVFPKGDCVSVGVAGMMAKTANFREPFDAFVSALCIGGTAERLQPGGRGLPAADFETRPGRDNVLLVGDAAGFVEPITGEGIGFAVECAPLAAQAITDALAAGRPEMAGGAYTAACRKNLLPTLRHARLARWFFFPDFCRRRAVRSLRRHPELVRWFLEILAGELTYPVYFRRALTRPWSRGRQEDARRIS
ncbi:MAG: NAD(P)/FAD-dependent oxidoreductase [Planctomycetota bacterium]